MRADARDRRERGPVEERDFGSGHDDHCRRRQHFRRPRQYQNTGDQLGGRDELARERGGAGCEKLGRTEVQKERREGEFRHAHEDRQDTVFRHHMRPDVTRVIFIPDDYIPA